MTIIDQNEMERLYLRAAACQRDGLKSVPPYIPKRVRMTTTVRPYGKPALAKDADYMVCKIGCEYPVESNKWGAVSAVQGDLSLGLKISEFIVIEWGDNPHF